MIEFTQFGDVQRLRMTTWRSRLVGYDVSAYLVRGILIDAGPWHARHDLLNALQDSRARGCIVTHWHEDHAGNVPALAAEGVPMWMAPYTEQTLRASFDPKFYRRFTWGESPRLSGTVAPFDPSPLEVIHTPGHSTDHHVVWDAETRTLFSADLWLGVKVRAVNETENPYAHIASLERAIALAPVRMFDAHRGLVENPVQALRAKLDWLRATVHVIEESLDRGESENAMLRDILGGEEAIGRLSQGEYARRNFARAVRAARNR
jgi:glyoxylase-like metal-dependent hydrolase (beta-lactamase superfamily II)